MPSPGTRSSNTANGSDVPLSSSSPQPKARQRRRSTIESATRLTTDIRTSWAEDRVFPVRSVVSVRSALPPTSPTSFSPRQTYSSTANSTGQTSELPSNLRRESHPHEDHCPQPHDTPTPPASKGVHPGNPPSAPTSDSQLTTTRFEHVLTPEGHFIATGVGARNLQHCDDEPIHTPGAVQSYGVLVVLQQLPEGLVVRVASENSQALLGLTPAELFQLDDFGNVFSPDQAEAFKEHIDFVRDADFQVETDGPDTFLLTLDRPAQKPCDLWCAMHVNPQNHSLIFCEFEFDNDITNPHVPSSEESAAYPENTVASALSAQEFRERTHSVSKPLRTLRTPRRRRRNAALEAFNVMAQIQDQFAAASTSEDLFNILVGIVQELTSFHRVMVYKFDQAWNGKVIAELVDPKATRDFYKGHNFPASDIPQQARDLYKINKVRMLYDREQPTARLVCRTKEDLEQPLDLTFSCLRAMSPVHLKYLKNMEVRSSMSISITAFNELWGLVSCHSYGLRGMRVSFPLRKMCRLIGEAASAKLERLSYASRLQARKLINTIPTQANPAGYIVASSEELLNLFHADFGLLTICGQTKILGKPDQMQEALAMLEYLRMRALTHIVVSQDINVDFPDIWYEAGFKSIAGLLLIPLSITGQDMMVFFRKEQVQEVLWAGNPHEKTQNTEGYLEPRKSFKTWTETMYGKSREWLPEEIETASVLCLVYGKFVEVWRQREAEMKNSQLKQLLLSNTAHEMRTPLNAIVNYLEIALETNIDKGIRDMLVNTHAESSLLVSAITDLLGATKSSSPGEQGLIQNATFDLTTVLTEGTNAHRKLSADKKIHLVVVNEIGSSLEVLGNPDLLQQAIAHVTENAINATARGSVQVTMLVASRDHRWVEVDICVVDTGIGISAARLEAINLAMKRARYSNRDAANEKSFNHGSKPQPDPDTKQDNPLGTGLSAVASNLSELKGRFEFTSEVGQGSRFLMTVRFQLATHRPPPSMSSASTVTTLTGDYFANVQQGVAQDTPATSRGILQRGSSANSAHSLMGRGNSVDSARSRDSFTGSLSSLTSELSVSSADRFVNALGGTNMPQGGQR